MSRRSNLPSPREEKKTIVPKAEQRAQAKSTTPTKAKAEAEDTEVPRPFLWVKGWTLVAMYKRQNRILNAVKHAWPKNSRMTLSDIYKAVLDTKKLKGDNMPSFEEIQTVVKRFGAVEDPGLWVRIRPVKSE